MDRLHDTVSAVVRRATHDGQPASRTFEEVRAAAYVARDGVAPPAAHATHAERRPVAPRLTEPWFC
jgi:hypothetical protein